MDWQFIFNIAVPLGGGVATLIVFPWFRAIRADATTAMAEVSRVDRALYQFKLDVSEKYTTHEDLKELKSMLSDMRGEMRESFSHVNERLDRKQDR